MTEIGEAAWWLAAAPGFGAVKIRQLSALAGRPKQILEQVRRLRSRTDGGRIWYEALCRDWNTGETLTGCTGEDAERLAIRSNDMERLVLHGAEFEKYAEEYHRWLRCGIRFITVWDEEYPGRLLPLYDRPFALYVRGALPADDRPSAAIVGARACSGYGAGQARRFARELAGKGVQIISGLAYGVDSAGHRGALESGVSGSTFAVLGCGPEKCYPPEHEALAEQIVAQGGGLISEFPPGTEPAAKNFPMRNRIISGLSDCLLVMEARRRSGSLITVDQALEQGREVFALPGHVDDCLSEGCHRLIQNGAAILTDSRDVLEYLAPNKRMAELSSQKEVQSAQKEDTMRKTAENLLFCDEMPDSVKKQANDSKFAKKILAPDKNMVYSCLDCQGKTIEELMTLTGLTLSQVRMELLELLMTDRAAETAKGYYVRLT